MSSGTWTEHVAPDGRLYYHNHLTGESSWVAPASFPGGWTPGVVSFPHYAAGAGLSFPAVFPAFSPPLGPGPPIQRARTANGPPGANLFIFHIPNDLTNKNLLDLFSPYGNVISARIMVERETGRSRGFGFVSFDDAPSAQDAMRAMDGFNVGRKRLKVTLKKEDSGAGGAS